MESAATTFEVQWKEELEALMVVAVSLQSVQHSKMQRTLTLSKRRTMTW